MPKFRIIHATTGSRLSMVDNRRVLVDGYSDETSVFRVKKERLEPSDYYRAAHIIVSNAFMAEEVGDSITPQATIDYLARGNLFGEERRGLGWMPLAGSAINIGELLQVMRRDPAEDPSWAIFTLLPDLPEERNDGQQGAA